MYTKAHRPKVVKNEDFLVSKKDETLVEALINNKLTNYFYFILLQATD